MASYLNNTQLTRKNTTHEYTQYQLEELIRCRDDINYFAEKYFTIVHIDHGKMLIPLYDFQKKLLTQFDENRFNITLQCRQSGKTTTVTIFILHFVLFHSDKNVALIANKAKMAREILSRIKLAFELLPNWMKPNVVEWNKGRIEFDNGSKVSANATSSSSIRGESVALLVVDECAFIENNTWEEFYTSTYPTIASGKTSKILLISTMNGYNHFNTMLEDAKKGISKYVFSEVIWYDVPNRDEEWKEETIANTSEEAFLQEHCNLPLGVSDTLISIRYIKEFKPKPVLTEINNIRVYIEPKKNHNYVSIVDTSRGKGLDFSAISIIDVTSYPFEQVATFYDDNTSYILFPDIVYMLSSKYNKASLLIENNDIGGHVCADLNNIYEYDNLINLSKNMELGLRTTTKTKAVGCLTLKTIIESHRLIINDENTLLEMSQFAKKGNSYSAKEGSHDDLMMTLVLFAYFTTTTYFEEIQADSVHDEIYNGHVDRMYEDLLPDMVVNDGFSDDKPTYIKEDGEMWVNSSF